MIKYIHAVKGGFIAFVLFTIGVIYIPGRGSSPDIEIILMISTFLFAILAGFFLARLNTRYNKITELVATEDAYFLSFFNTARFLGKEFEDNIKELIDTYYIIAYDFNSNYYKSNAGVLQMFYEELEKVDIKKNIKAESVFDEMVIFLSQIEENRNKDAVLTLDKVTRGQWGILLLLGSIIIFFLFFLKTDALYSQITTVLFSTILTLIILIIRDLSSLRLNQGEDILQESGQEIFESIGKMRYYPEKHLKDGMTHIPKHVKRYRLGTHKPGAEKFEIIVVENK